MLNTIKIFNINPVQKPAFKRKIETDTDNAAKDRFENSNDNIASIQTDSYGHLKNINFKEPVTIAKALRTLYATKNKELKIKLFNASYTEDELFDMYVEINSTRELRNLKVKGLTGMGVYALAFETTDGEVIKVTKGNHFPCKRKPDFFDLPIKKHGQTGRTHYYIEEKVSQNDITDEEIEQLINKIKQADYDIIDYLLVYEKANNKYGHPFKKEQFGHAKDNKIYLIDPGCAVKDKKLFVAKLIEKIRKICSKKQ